MYNPLRDIQGRFTDKVRKVTNHKKTVVFLAIVLTFGLCQSITYATTEFNKFVVANNPIKVSLALTKQTYVAQASVATTTKSTAKLDDIAAFQEKLNNFKAGLVDEALQDPETTFACKQRVEELVNKKINILTKTTF